MGRRLLGVGFLFLISFLILFVSLFRASSLYYRLGDTFSFSAEWQKDPLFSGNLVDYQLAYPGRIAPDNFLWFAKPLRDKLWLYFNSSSVRKSQISMIIADKRIASGLDLAQRGKINLSLVVCMKAEQYLLESYGYLEKSSVLSDEILEQYRLLNLSSLKHLEVLNIIYLSAPENMKPDILKIMDTPKSVYERTGHILRENSLTPRANPFGDSI